jgi:hypothetical protein
MRVSGIGGEARIWLLYFVIMMSTEDALHFNERVISLVDSTSLIPYHSVLSHALIQATNMMRSVGRVDEAMVYGQRYCTSAEAAVDVSVFGRNGMGMILHLEK